MPIPRNTRIRPRVLCVDDELGKPDTARGRRIRSIVAELQGRGIEVIEALSCEDGVAGFESDAAVHCLLLDWTLGANSKESYDQSTKFLHAVRAPQQRRADLPDGRPQGR